MRMENLLRLVPNFYRNKKKDKERLSLNIDYKGAPWVKNISRPNEISRGLQDRHIAIWQSHGNYFKMIKTNGDGNALGVILYHGRYVHSIFRSSIRDSHVGECWSDCLYSP